MKNKQKLKSQNSMTKISFKRRREIQKINKMRKKRNNFPEFMIADYDKATIPKELITQVLKIVKNINFKDKVSFKEEHIMFFYEMRKVGFPSACVIS